MPSKGTPVEYVGRYLTHLCNDKTVKDHFLQSRSHPSRLIEKEKLLPVSILNIVMQLLYMVILAMYVCMHRNAMCSTLYINAGVCMWWLYIIVQPKKLELFLFIMADVTEEVF